MNIGDIVTYENAYWKVITQSRAFRTCCLMTLDGTKAEVPDDSDVVEPRTVRVLCNPASQWPFAVLAGSSKPGPVQEIRRGSQTLRPFEEWVPSDFVRSGGAYFFNPSLKLRVGEVLVAVHAGGKLSRITITRGFGTVRRKLARAIKPEIKAPQPAHERLLGADILGED
jgi:hypothetical protein